jgi:hypothetical protein
MKLFHNVQLHVTSRVTFLYEANYISADHSGRVV